MLVETLNSDVTVFIGTTVQYQSQSVLDNDNIVVSEQKRNCKITNDKMY